MWDKETRDEEENMEIGTQAPTTVADIDRMALRLQHLKTDMAMSMAMPTKLTTHQHQRPHIVSVAELTTHSPTSNPTSPDEPSSPGGGFTNHLPTRRRTHARSNSASSFGPQSPPRDVLGHQQHWPLGVDQDGVIAFYRAAQTEAVLQKMPSNGRPAEHNPGGIHSSANGYGNGLQYGFPNPPGAMQRQQSPPVNGSAGVNGSPNQQQPQQRPSTRRSRRRPSTTSSAASYGSLSMYPPPTKPLPPLPPPSARASQRVSSQDSLDSSLEILRFSESSGQPSISDVASIASSYMGQASHGSDHHRSEVIPADRASIMSNRSGSSAQVEIVSSRLFISDGKQKKQKNGNTVYSLDMSANASVLASKHGNNVIKFWDVESGAVENAVKFSSYTDAQSRSRDYLIHSHAILSETKKLAAISVKFGRTLEIVDWSRRKCLQTIDQSDRWAAGRFEFSESAWGQLAIYHGEDETLDVYTAAPAERQKKKPFMKGRTIDLRNASLPFVPKYPELAISPTSPLLVMAAGPRPPRMGQPPPDRETLLVAWDIQETDGGGGGLPSKPYRVARPWQHREIDTAIPCDVATYGSVVVSIWIPATFRAVPIKGATGYNLQSVAVPHKIVLVWDLTVNSTRTFAIPNTTACVSPDCRFVAYCDYNSNDISARRCLAILDVHTGREIWVWKDRYASATDKTPKPGFEQFEDLGRITELAFSPDAKLLVVGDVDGRTGVYELRELAPDRLQLSPRQ